MHQPRKLVAGIFAMGVSLASYSDAAETARVLPKGVSRARIVTIFTHEVEDRYDTDGQLVPLTDTLNRSVTIHDFVAKEPRLGQLVGALNSLEAGLGDQLANSNLYSHAQTQVKNYLLAYEYGITRQLSVGIRAPIVHRTMNANFSASGVNNAEYMSHQIGRLSPEMSAGIYDLGSKQFNTAFFESAVFTSKGYEVPHSFSKTQLGDTEFGTKYNFYNDERVYLTAQLGGRAPTGAQPSLSNPLDRGTSVGSWATALSFFQEYQANSFLSFGAMQKALYNFPDTTQRAVPKDENDALPSLLPQDGQVRDVTRYQGMLFESEISSTLRFFDSSVSTWGAYQFATKGADRFKGDGNLYYQGLSRDTHYKRTALELGAGYSTIPAFRKKKFAFPMEIEALYNTMLTGQNTPLVSYVRMDLKLYF